MTTPAAFYVEDLGLSEVLAKRIEWFQTRFRDHKAIDRISGPWTKHGVRLYIDLWSQNRRPALDSLERAYYDVEANDIFIVAVGKNWELSWIIWKFTNRRYAGAKTRDAIKLLAEEFYAEARAWD